MPFPAPRPNDWNQPGDERVIAEAAAQLKRKEPEDMPMPAVGLKSDPYVPQEVDPNAKAYVDLRNQMAADLREVDPFRPIREIGREESTTFHFIIEDNRPFASVPLSGPGAYEVTILRRR